MTGPAAAAAAAAVDADNLFIPLIDFSKFLNGNEDQRLETAQQILSGFQKAGFIYLKNHGIPDPDIQHTFSQSAEFFKRPQSQKTSMEWTGADSNRGYTCMGREKTTQLTDKDEIEQLRASNPDLKESYEIGRENVPNHPNPWPDKFDDSGKVFRDHMQDFFLTCNQLQMKVMRALALGLGIGEHWFDDFFKDSDHTLRLLHYPSVKKDVFVKNKGQVRAGAHSDYGSITLLFQDNRGGLQVQSPQGTFVDAKPIPGTIVVNAADLLSRWSNDTIKSTVHRVVEPPAPEEGDEHPARYSIAYFCNPDFSKMIEVIPNTLAAAETKKYEPVNCWAYLAQRLAATY